MYVITREHIAPKKIRSHDAQTLFLIGIPRDCERRRVPRENLTHA